MTTPVRIQRRRTKGYDMQAQSRAINGLPAVYVGRPSRWGNPFRFRSPARSVLYYEVWVERYSEDAQRELAGHNLACWCRLCPAHQDTGLPLGELCPDCQPCHADVLLNLANVETTP